MSERRPHWDEQLIEAVGDLIYTDYDGDDLVCAVIAAVEDGLGEVNANVAHTAAVMAQRAEKAEHKIQAVRDAVDNPPPWEYGCHFTHDRCDRHRRSMRLDYDTKCEAALLLEYEARIDRIREALDNPDD